ncbi:MAG: CinA family protein [Lachnospiraceae bacterium]|jgi:nicotinamide-nucleotide amidase|nr:CinA family protein [Lachnospiraceae bacterium]MCH4030396.1 CinA family protein [Lachnospiraceae bacterium]MCH4069608.1 CinA family protein [Lachnospiraceae bacterium]MCH4107456.1 CinA family protein [Lachnospiraceae bacterium]MCI1301693.1 CinA family protein [Lachnospiraceae bacterium]
MISQALELKETACIIVTTLKACGRRMATAESLTGGLIAASIISIPGASECLEEGYITYSDAAKSKMLGIPAENIREWKAVSENTARAMAEMAAKLADCEYGVSATGVAGPDKEDGQDVGTVFIGCSYPDENGGRACEVRRLSLSGTRNEIRTRTVVLALKLLLSHMPARQKDRR